MLLTTEFCAVAFCFKYDLSYNYSEVNNVWRSFSRVFEVLIASPFTRTDSMPNLPRLDELH